MTQGKDHFQTQQEGLVDIRKNAISGLLALCFGLLNTHTYALGVGYSTYLGGEGEDHGYAIAVDRNGCVYVTGNTKSADFPVTELAFASKNPESGDVFVVKLNPNASGKASLVWSVRLGGRKYDEGNDIALDNAGNVYVTGITRSDDFPSRNAFQRNIGGSYDAFVAKLSPAGDLIHCTFLGGKQDDRGEQLAIDGKGHVYVVGSTWSEDFPTRNPCQSGNKGDFDVFLAELSSDGRLLYSTYLGGESSDYGRGVAADGQGNVYITGYTHSADLPVTDNAYQDRNAGRYDMFVAGFNTGLSGESSLLYSTYLGTAHNDFGHAIAADKKGYIYVCGQRNGISIIRFHPSSPGTVLCLDSLLGRKATVLRMAVDEEGNACIIGHALGNIRTRDACQPEKAGWYDIFVAKFDTNVSDREEALICSTYLGGSNPDYGYGIALAKDGSIYLTGYTESVDFPIRNQYQADQGWGDVFVTRLTD